MSRPIIGMIVAILLFAARDAWSEDPAPKPDQSPAAPSRQELEKKFQEMLSGATLTGHFTSGKGDAASAKEEKYSIESVTKMPLADDVWLFKARIQYGNHDATVPLPLRVVWAGDTPVITLDKFPVPGFGSFTARVLIYDNKYVGTWDGGDHGGVLFGKITRDTQVKDGNPNGK